VALTGNVRSTYRVLVRRPERKIRLGRPRHRNDNNIKMDLQEVCWGSMEWIDLAQNRRQVAGASECGIEQLGSVKFREFLT